MGYLSPMVHRWFKQFATAQAAVVMGFALSLWTPQVLALPTGWVAKVLGRTPEPTGELSLPEGFKFYDTNKLPSFPTPPRAEKFVEIPSPFSFRQRLSQPSLPKTLSVPYWGRVRVVGFEERERTNSGYVKDRLEVIERLASGRTADISAALFDDVLCLAVLNDQHLVQLKVPPRVNEPSLSNSDQTQLLIDQALNQDTNFGFVQDEHGNWLLAQVELSGGPRYSSLAVDLPRYYGEEKISLKQMRDFEEVLSRLWNTGLTQRKILAPEVNFSLWSWNLGFTVSFFKTGAIQVAADDISSNSPSDLFNRENIVMAEFNETDLVHDSVRGLFEIPLHYFLQAEAWLHLAEQDQKIYFEDLLENGHVETAFEVLRYAVQRETTGSDFDFSGAHFGVVTHRDLPQTKGFPKAKSLKYHERAHLDDVLQLAVKAEGFTPTPEQRAPLYQDLALDFWNQGKAQQMILRRPDGSLVKFDFLTKEFSAIQPDGALMTYFVVRPGGDFSFKSHSEYLGSNLKRKRKDCEQNLKAAN